MKVPAQIAFKNMSPSKFAHVLVDAEIDKLDDYRIHITHCRVTIERVQHNEFRTYRVHAFLNLPGNEILVDIDTAKYAGSNRLGAAIHEAFFQIRQRLMKQKNAEVKKYHRATGLKHMAQDFVPEPQAVS